MSGGRDAGPAAGTCARPRPVRCLVGPGEHRLHAGAPGPRRPARPGRVRLVPQFGGQRRRAGIPGGRRHGQRRRPGPAAAGAQPDQRAAASGSAATRSRPRRRASSSRASASAQDIQVDEPGAFGSDQASELGAAGHDAPRSPGWPGSSGRTCAVIQRVVQHDQHLPAGQQAAVHGRLRRRGRPGSRLGRDSERVQESPHGRVGRDRAGPRGRIRAG